LFLIKPTSEDPGISVDLVLTSAEREWDGQDTNRAWTQAGKCAETGRLSH
jgi:hypothetical protein